MIDMLDLIQQDVALRKVSNRDGGEWAGPCPICGGKDRFHVWPNSQRNVKFWCRASGEGCGLSGDEITYLRKVRHLSFREAAARVGKELPETDRARHTRERAMKEKILTDYWQWYHEQLVVWLDRFCDLTTEIKAAEIGYLATGRRPDLYTKTEQEYWADRLANLYHALPQVEHACDLLTYDHYEKERFAWWQTESNNKRLEETKR